MQKLGSLVILISVILFLSLLASVQAQNTSNTTNTTTSSPSPAPTITVTSPNGGQSWQLGSTQTITWSSSGTINYVMLDLIDTAGQFKVTNLVNVQGNPGSASWSIPTYVPTGSYKLRISTCTWLTSKDTCDQSKADVYDLSDSYFSVIAATTPTVSGCSTNSDCAIQNLSWAGATFCDSTGLKLMQYRQSPTCQSGTCIYTTSELAVKDDCSSSGKICDFTTAGGGVYACVSGTPPNACPPNTLLATRCVCGSNYLDSYNLEHFPPHYCCGSGSNLNLIGGGTCPTCSSTQLWSCYDQASCINVGGYWYNNYCINKQSPSPLSSNQTNNTSSQTQNYTTTQSPAYTTAPTYSPTNSPIYPSTTSTPYPSYSSPSLFCNTDQDCSWLITNSCPESAGANWECRSLLKPPSGYAITGRQSAICPQVLSPKPSANCGCVQNTCTIFQLQKPTEPPRKIGNTDFDTTKLLAVVIQIEQLKIKLDFLKSATVKLSNYYNVTGNQDSSTRWSAASALLQTGIDKLESLKSDIRSKISNFTIEDLREVKQGVKSVIDIIRDVVKTVLAPSTPPGTGSPRGGDPNQTNQTGTPRGPINQTNQSSGGGSSSGNLTIPSGPSGSNQTNQTNTSIPSSGGGGQGNSTNRTNSTGG